MLEYLEGILIRSGIIDLFELKQRDEYPDQLQPYVSYRVKSNVYRIRAFEFWGSAEEGFFRIYHGSKLQQNLKESLQQLPGYKASRVHTIDFEATDYTELAKLIQKILLDKEIIQGCRETSNLAKTSRFEGLELPDLDMTENHVMGQTFTWRDIIAIHEDNSENNLLKRALCQKGIYIQRSQDGTSRYIGSANGSGGILGRWMSHLEFNGNAHHLNLYVLENGYNEIIFSVIEFYEEEDILKREAMWKEILGTINRGAYNGFQLNRN